METFENNLVVLSHPIVKHNLAIIRDKNSDCEKFRNALKKITYCLLLEASKNLPLKKIEVETPIKKTVCETFDDSRQLIIAPILRAGLIFSEVAQELLPFANIHHIGMYRNEETLQPVWYYDKNKPLLENKNNVNVIIVDPMLATGNSAKDALQNFIDKGINQKNIVFMSLISSVQGVNTLSTAYPDIRIVTSALDNELNSKGYIVPGLGDAGDRIFNTL